MTASLTCAELLRLVPAFQSFRSSAPEIALLVFLHPVDRASTHTLGGVLTFCCNTCQSYFLLSLPAYCNFLFLRAGLVSPWMTHLKTSLTTFTLIQLWYCFDHASSQCVITHKTLCQDGMGSLNNFITRAPLREQC